MYFQRAQNKPPSCRGTHPSAMIRLRRGKRLSSRAMLQKNISPGLRGDSVSPMYRHQKEILRGGQMKRVLTLPIAHDRLHPSLKCALWEFPQAKNCYHTWILSWRMSTLLVVTTFCIQATCAKALTEHRPCYRSLFVHRRPNFFLVLAAVGTD